MAAQEFDQGRGWTDGLPVVPPTAAAVEACPDWVGMTPDEFVGIEPVRERPISAEKLAVNAVMAGCLPMHFPVVRSEEHTSELQSLMRISYAVFCLKTKKYTKKHKTHHRR